MGKLGWGSATTGGAAVGVGAGVAVGVGFAVGAAVGVGVGVGEETATTIRAALATPPAAPATTVLTARGLGDALLVSVEPFFAPFDPFLVVVDPFLVVVDPFLVVVDPFLVVVDALFVVADAFFVGVFLLVTVAVIVWLPSDAPLGTTNETIIRPARSTRKVGMPLVEPSKVSWPRLLGWSPWPVAVTVAPVGAWVGERLIETAALATASGIRMTGTRTATTRSRKVSLVKRLWRPVTGGAPVRTESGAALYRIG